MPKAKRLKSSAAAKPQPEVEPPPQPTDEPLSNPTIDDENEFAQLARKYWLKPSSKTTTKVKVKNDVLKKEFWDPLVEQKFSYKALLVLENLQALERCVEI